MRRTFGRNKHQKAAHKVGERKSSSAEVEQMLQLSFSHDPEERLLAAEHLCPCHVRKRIDSVWDALSRMMEDPDARVKQAAWHTLEDGGVSTAPGTLANLERIFHREHDTKVRRFADGIIGPTLRAKRAQEMSLLQLAGRSQVKQRGKCDFCGAAGVPVNFDPETPIPGGGSTRSALICEKCAPGG